VERWIRRQKRKHERQRLIENTFSSFGENEKYKERNKDRKRERHTDRNREDVHFSRKIERRDRGKR
jgi:hypothetical protein